MPFINYSDDEVRKYHPICERALNLSLSNLGLSSDYEVKHHYRYQGIIPDFVIINKQTKNILMVIEVKRTPSQVMSTRYRLQAQSYISNAASQNFEQQYFAITNLEKTYLFKYDSRNTSVINQIIEPSPFNTGSFSDPQTDFKNQLVYDFSEMINIAYMNSGRFQLNYEEILQELSNYTDDIDNWHSAVTVIGYELIRSILRNYQPNAVSTWGNAISYNRNPSVLQSLINSVDFDSLGIGTILNSRSLPYWQPALLNKASLIGSRTFSGDEFASAIHELLVKGHEGEGVVPTDMDLSAALAELVSSEWRNPETKFYCDPASGSGNLLSAIIERNQNISPSSIWANDSLEFLRDILSIRFGLKFPRIISPTNAPKITSENIANFSPIDFLHIDAIVMNPPYVSGVRDSLRKQLLFQKITRITRRTPKTLVGQMPLEGPFLELIINLVKDGTVMGIVFPEQHLFGKGPESKAIRELLLNEFGLKKIFTYPRTGLFEDVTKGTVIMIGIKGIISNDIEIINSSLPIEQIDLSGLVNSGGFSYGIKKSNVSRVDLLAKQNTGWKSAMYPSYDAIIGKLSGLISTLQRAKYFRGAADNSGEGKYLFITKQSYWSQVENLVPSTWLKDGIQNVQDYSTSGKLIHSNSTLKALCPPSSAFIKGSVENNLLIQILTIANQSVNSTVNTGTQPRRSKTPQEVADIIKTVSRRIVPAGKLLIPRALRNEFKVFETSSDTIVSTNFIVLDLNAQEKEAFLSWLMSIFGQIQIELLSKPQEGMRKIEVGEMGLIAFPCNLSLLTNPIVNNFGYKRSFDNYSISSPTDEYWKNEFNISDSDYLGLVNLMTKLIDLRNP